MSERERIDDAAVEIALATWSIHRFRARAAYWSCGRWTVRLLISTPPLQHWR